MAMLVEQAGGKALTGPGKTVPEGVGCRVLGVWCRV